MIRVESPDLQRLAVGSKAYPKALQAATRKQLLAIGKEASKAAQDKIRNMPVKGDVPYRRAGGMRSDIAKAVKVSATINSTAGAQVRVYISKSQALSEGRRFRLPQMLDKGQTFRHRVYGKDTWVDQQPYPWFRQTIAVRAAELRQLMATTFIEAAAETLPNVR